MTWDFIPPLLAYAFVATGTPGPNNVMLMASGANFGVRRTIPHIAGVNIGVTVMLALIGLGLARLFEAFPVIRLVLTVVSIAYLLYLAFRIATAAPPSPDAKAKGKPLTFLQAALFQWVNPKAWAMSLTVVTVYAPGESTPAVIATALIFGAVNLPCITAWTVLGREAGRLLRNPRRLRVFNIVMAVLLVASLYPTLR